jgi:hypothetical protein
MANTFKKIQTVTVGSGGSSTISFTSIPQTYTDLKIVFSGRGIRTGQMVDLARITFNGSSAAEYSLKNIYGDYTAAYSSGSSGQTSLIPQGFVPASSATANVFGNNEIYIPNYTSANFKSVSFDIVLENNSSTANEGYLTLTAGLWSNTAAITSITFVPHLGTAFDQYTTATLYGVSNATLVAGEAYATGGQQIYADATYWYHVFNSSGTFTPTRALTCDYLVIAGGGNGGTLGGGGAGGMRSTVGATGGGGSLESALSLTAQAYTVTIGAGGASQGTSGNNSVFGTITSTGGGGGSGAAGGSGGGGDYTSTAGGTRTASPVQGNNGGTGINGGTYAAGGGGGAGAAGSAGSGGQSGAGGAGATTAISGTSTTYAGGGGGGYTVQGAARGNGGSGGGGIGGGSGSGNPAGSGTINTGSGGGAASGGGSASGAGGSGIVIVRYAK